MKSKQIPFPSKYIDRLVNSINDVLQEATSEEQFILLNTLAMTCIMKCVAQSPPEDKDTYVNGIITLLKIQYEDYKKARMS